MTRLAWAAYALAAVGLGASCWAGWPAAVVAVGALAASAALAALEQRHVGATEATAQAVNDARSEAAAAREDVKRLRTEVQAALQQRRQAPGY